MRFRVTVKRKKKPRKSIGPKEVTKALMISGGLLTLLGGGVGLINYSASVLIIILGLFAFTVGLSISNMLSRPRNPMLITGRGEPYYIADQGIYRGYTLLVRWNEVDRIFVVDEYTAPGTALTLKRNLPRIGVYSLGTFVVLTKDGRRIRIPDVIDPWNMLGYIRKVYLKR